MSPSTRQIWAEAVNRNALLRAERLLAEIRLRVKHAADSDVAAHARADLRRLAGALDGVIGLHRRDTDGTCRSCSGGRRWVHRNPHRHRWPCATLRTVTRSLDDTGQTR